MTDQGDRQRSGGGRRDGGVANKVVGFGAAAGLAAGLVALGLAFALPLLFGWSTEGRVITWVISATVLSAVAAVLAGRYGIKHRRDL